MNVLTAIMLMMTPEAPNAPAYLNAALTGSDRYRKCVRLVTDDVETGRRAAQSWAGEGGGAQALHCLAIADLAAGFPKLAAARLNEIAERPDAGDENARARLLAEAALALLEAGDALQAEEAIIAAKTRAGSLAEIDFVAAKVYAAGAKWQLAEAAVDAAEKGGVKTAEAFIIRAKARRALGRDQEAAEDVVAALNLNPLNIDALTLRGELQQAGVKIDAYYESAKKKR